MGRRAVVVQSQGLPALFDHLGSVPGQKEGVGQIQPRIEIVGRQLHRALIGGNGVGGVALVQISVPSRHQARKSVSADR